MSSRLDGTSGGEGVLYQDVPMSGELPADARLGAPPLSSYGQGRET
jgi:hypothetical protein